MDDYERALWAAFERHQQQEQQESTSATAATSSLDSVGKAAADATADDDGGRNGSMDGGARRQSPLLDTAMAPFGGCDDTFTSLGGGGHAEVRRTMSGHAAWAIASVEPSTGDSARGLCAEHGDATAGVRGGGMGRRQMSISAKLGASTYEPPLRWDVGLPMQDCRK